MSTDRKSVAAKAAEWSETRGDVCPHCGNPIWVHDGRYLAVGKKVKVCRKCQRPVFTGKREWTNLSAKERRTYIFYSMAMVWTIVAVVMSLFLLIMPDLRSSVPAIAGGLFGVALSAWVMKFLRIWRSLKRAPRLRTETDGKSDASDRSSR
jgi:hypothetical protein